jgi:hypothetical protein
LEGSRYREGLYFFYPELSGECELFPTSAAVSDLVLLTCGELRRRLGTREWYVSEQGVVELTQTDVEGLLYGLKSKYGEYWSKEHREMSLPELAETMTQHMSEWGLGFWMESRDGGKRFVVAAVVSRWNADYALDEEATV